MELIAIDIEENIIGQQLIPKYNEIDLGYSTCVEPFHCVSLLKWMAQ